MSYLSDGRAIPPSYLIARSQTGSGYTLWELNLASDTPLRLVRSVPLTELPADYRVFQSGGYLIAYSMSGLRIKSQTIPYRVLPLDIEADDPLSVKPVLEGAWDREKFWGFYNHYFWNPETDPDFALIPINQYVLCNMPTQGRNTFRVWNFDPRPLDTEDGADPLDRPLTEQDALTVIDYTSTLIPMDNYLVEWRREQQSYRLWSFDPQQRRPIELPYIVEAACPGISPESSLMAVGNQLLEIDPGQNTYRVWAFEALSRTPIYDVLYEAPLPEGFDTSLTITALCPRIPVDAWQAQIPGTMDFMRDRVDHVVVYMLESRTFDSVLGWLYEQSGVDLNFINGPDVFDGLKPEYHNSYDGKDYPVEKVLGGVLNADEVLAFPKIDPFHGTPDSINQMFSTGYPGYFAGDVPDMGGFVENNSSAEVMQTFTPTQLPVLNTLAASYGVSDAWFSGLPGGTDSNRAMALTGSSYDIIMTYEGGPDYQFFPDRPHRPSVWKTLWNEGETDWKIYYSVLWYDHVFTYQLYLRREIAEVDQDVLNGTETYIAPMEQFFRDARGGSLPKFSFLEPAWIAPNGATSYHPGASGDMVPAERQLMAVYEALRASPAWERTAFVITFSKGGGMYDHASPPRTVNPWPKDDSDGFRYDVLGPRVPAIVVSPLVDAKTVFRSDGEDPLNASSTVATVLDWCGIPRARWGLGDRMPRSETFEMVFQRDTARTDWPKLHSPYDKNFPPRAWEQLPQEMLSYTLGPKTFIDELYPPAIYAKPELRLGDMCDVIAHYTGNSLEVDGLEQCRASTALEDGSYVVTLTGRAERERLERFAERHQEIFSDRAAGKAITGKRLLQEMGVWNPMAGYHVNDDPNDGECKWHLFPPLGLNMIGQKGILLMHYPPWQVIQDGTMLDCMTMSRWNAVLEAAGFDAQQAGQYRTIVDVNPIAAPGSGQSEYPNDYLPIMMASGFFDGEGRDYIRSMLKLYLNPPGHTGKKYTLPLLVCGSPLYDPQAPGWFKAAFVKDMPLDENGIPQNNVLQAGTVRLHPDSPLETPYLIANHMIAAGETGQCTNDPAQIPDIRKYEAQDLVAASFLQAYADDPDTDPQVAKAQACERWFGNPTGDGAPKPPSEDDKAAICALAQMDLFFVPTPEPHPKYDYAQALDQCKTAKNDPCSPQIAPTGAKNAMSGCGCGGDT